MNQEQFLKIGISIEWWLPLKDVLDRFELNTPNRQAAFIGQCFYESAGFTEVEEDLNYSAEALLKTWPVHFPTLALAKLYANNPSAIANLVYADRMGNGDKDSGEGWKYRGRGLIQITGRDTYKGINDILKIDCLANPDQLTETGNAALASGQFWVNHGLNELADAADWDQITQRINGGLLGMQARRAKINELLQILS